MATKIFRNAWVNRRRADDISALANDLRVKCGVENECNLNIVELLRVLECTDLPGKGRLKIRIYPEKPRGYKAFVSYKPLELHAEKLTFERARWNVDHNSKYILAHELGHIVLHDQLAIPFTDRDTKQRTMGTEDTQAETQADCFADHLLLPDHVISQFATTDQIVKFCGVSVALAERRFPKRKHPNAFKTVYLGEFCPNCQNLSLTRRGYLLECDHCGESFSGL